MVIDIDVSRAVTGTDGFTQLLMAIESADAHDENEWVEFKANLNPLDKQSRFPIAKAIIAFANRDPSLAAGFFAGRAYIVIGLEPGNLVGAPRVDPADLESAVNALIASPAPEWDIVNIDYKGQHVLIITVGAPRAGDPIACVGKSSGEAVDGMVFVRRVGKSDRAKSADLRRLSDRLLENQSRISGLTVRAETSMGIPKIDVPDEWTDAWLEAERERLLAPLRPAPPPEPMTDADLRRLGMTRAALDRHRAQATQASKAASAALGVRRRPEDRTEEQYRAEVARYLEDCRAGLASAFDRLKSGLAREVTFTVTNETDRNFAEVEVDLHIEGNVDGYDEFDGSEDADATATVTELIKKRLDAPRPWGPYTEPLVGLRPETLRSLTMGLGGLNLPTGDDLVGRPEITNGGSVIVRFPALNLRPASAYNLGTVRLVATVPVGSEVSMSWSATASNVSGTITGSSTLDVTDRALDAVHLLRHDES